MSAKLGPRANEKGEHHVGVSHSRSQSAVRYDLPFRLRVPIALTGLDCSRASTVALREGPRETGGFSLMGRSERRPVFGIE